jgi:hypothetical protein
MRSRKVPRIIRAQPKYLVCILEQSTKFLCAVPRKFQVLVHLGGPQTPLVRHRTGHDINKCRQSDETGYAWYLATVKNDCAWQFSRNPS